MWRTPPSSPSVTSCATSVTTATRTKLNPPSLKLLDLKQIKLLIELTMIMIPVTLEPTNDGAVHNQMLHSYLYFLFVLQSCVKLLHERTNTQCTKALKKYRSLVTGCLIVAALSTDSLSMTSFTIPLSEVTNLSISIIPLRSL